MHEQERNPMKGVKLFPEYHARHDGDDEEEDDDDLENALTASELARFLAALKLKFPQHYLMAVFGLFFGLRPCELRPLRYRGAHSDIDWEKGVLRVRRSQTIGQEEPRHARKGGKRSKYLIPPEILAIARWHVAWLEVHRASEQDPELLFPATVRSRRTNGRDARYRSKTVLYHPFKKTLEACGLSKRFTPYGLRRSARTLCAQLGVDREVSKALLGHSTDRAHEIYLAGFAQREAVANTVQAMFTAVEQAGLDGGGAGPAPPADPATTVH
jgi:integrase